MGRNSRFQGEKGEGRGDVDMRLLQSVGWFGWPAGWLRLRSKVRYLKLDRRKREAQVWSSGYCKGEGERGEEECSALIAWVSTEGRAEK